jgi:hypothetical protein
MNRKLTTGNSNPETRRHSPGSMCIMEKCKISKEQKNKQSERESELNTVRCKNLGNYI